MSLLRIVGVAAGAAISLRAPFDGTIEAQLIHSRDGVTWRRFADRSPLIPRGTQRGGFDSGCVLCSASAPVQSRDGQRTFHFYTGINTSHGGPMPPKRIAIGLASWRRDGFVSLDAGAYEATVLTRAVRAEGGGAAVLELNVDASAGSLRVALLPAEAETAEAEPLPGFATADCEVVESDSVGIVVRWRAGPSLPSSAFRILFEMVDASLFTFRLRPAVGDDEAGAAPRL